MLHVYTEREVVKQKWFLAKKRWFNMTRVWDKDYRDKRYSQKRILYRWMHLFAE